MDGSITANGIGKNGVGGCGSGGGIYINAGILRGSGTISAQGGNNLSNSSGTTGGGGGRVAVYYDDITDFDTENITAYGGTGNSANGGGGTLYLKSSTQTYGDLIVDNNGLATTVYSTPLTSVGTGVSTDLMSDTMTDNIQSWRMDDLTGLYLNPNINQGGVHLILNNDDLTITTDITGGEMTASAVIGDTYRGKQIVDHLFIRGSAMVETLDDIEVKDPVTDTLNNTFEIDGWLKANSLEINTIPLIISNGGLIVEDIITSGTITSLSLTNSTMEMPIVTDINSLSLDNSSLTAYNSITATDLTINNGSTVTSYGSINAVDIIVDNNSEMTSAGTIQSNNLTVTNNSLLDHPSTTLTDEYRLEISAANTLTIDLTSNIDVAGRGYVGSNRGGNFTTYGYTIGNITTGGSSGNSGGSYGGLGGKYGSGNVNSAYGSIYNPNDLGSGGGGGSGGSQQKGENGGGLVRITAGEIVLDGSITANGIGKNGVGGCGSGGGIYINAGILRGIGTITANGGNNLKNASGATGGGGGRVAVYYNDITGFDTANITSYGGTGYSANGGSGTIYLKSSTQTYGDLIVDNNGTATTVYSTLLASVGTGVSTGLTADMMTDNTQSWRTDDLEGISLNPNINQGTTPNEVFPIMYNDDNSITVDNTTLNLTDVAVIADTYIGELYIDNLTIINGAKVETLDRIFYNSLDITGGELKADNELQVGKKSDDLMQDTRYSKLNEALENEKLDTAWPVMLFGRGNPKLDPAHPVNPVKNKNQILKQDQDRIPSSVAEPILLASLSPVSTNDSSTMTDAATEINSQSTPPVEEISLRSQRPPRLNHSYEQLDRSGNVGQVRLKESNNIQSKGPVNKESNNDKCSVNNRKS